MRNSGKYYIVHASIKNHTKIADNSKFSQTWRDLDQPHRQNFYHEATIKCLIIVLVQIFT
jgi:hypothetical protein